MFDVILLSCFTIYIIITTIHIVSKDVLVGCIYFFLFLYSIFAQIGYCFFPELSIFIKAYFGKPIFYNFYFFNFLSFVCFYLVYILSTKIKFNLHTISVIKYNSSILKFFLIAFIVLFYTYNYYYFIANYNELNYINASDPDFLQHKNILYKIYAISFKSLSVISIIFYVQIRLKNKNSSISIITNKSLTFVFVLSIFTLFIFSDKMGSRTDIVAFLIGALVFEIKMGLNFKKLISIFLFISVVLYYLFLLEEKRLNGNFEAKAFSTIESLLLKDYYSPPHMLYTLMYFNYIDPLFVLKSNLGNSLIGLNIDYLQLPITELINPGIANRSQGYAFYMFSEGFFFMGYFGFIYNAIVLFVGLSIWKKIYNSSNKYFNLMIYCILATQSINLARSQSSYFIKNILVIIVPMLFIIFISSGLTYKIKIK